IQAVVLLPGLLLAILVASAAAAGTTRAALAEGLRPYRRVGILVVSLGVLGAAAQLARSGSLKGLLGSYGVLQQGYSPWGSLRWLVLSLADLALLVGIALLAVTPLALAHSLRGPGASSRSRALAAVFVGFCVPSLLTVAAFSSSAEGGHRLHERY